MPGTELVAAAEETTQPQIHLPAIRSAGQQFETFFNVMFEAIRELGSLRISNEQRAAILKSNNVPLDYGRWSAHDITRLARQMGIRLTPVNPALYRQHQIKVKQQHDFLQLILAVVREGNTSLDDIKAALTIKYADGEIQNTLIPGTGTISRILKYCKNDSPELATAINDAFAEGEAKKAESPHNRVRLLLKHIASAAPQGAG